MSGGIGFRRAVVSAQPRSRVVGRVLGQQARVGLLRSLHGLPFAFVDAVFYARVGVAHEDVVIDAESGPRAATQHAQRMQRDRVVGRLAGDLVAQRILATGVER